MNRYLKYSKHIVYTDNYNKIDEYEISNINTIIKAIENEKYIKFQRVYKTTKKNDIIYKPLGILVDNEMLYLAFIFQPQINKVHVLDFIPIKSIHNIEVIENKIYNYVNLKNLYKKDFPLYADFYQELFEDGNIEVLVDIYEKKMYYKHSCEIKYYNESFIEELESICIDIDTEYREEENYTKYFSYIYYENEENLFEWIYSKKKEKEKIKEYYNEIMEDYIEEKQQLQTESNHKQKLHSIEFSNNKVRERYVKYEIKRDTQS